MRALPLAGRAGMNRGLGRARIQWSFLETGGIASPRALAKTRSDANPLNSSHWTKTKCDRYRSVREAGAFLAENLKFGSFKESVFLSGREVDLEYVDLFNGFYVMTLFNYPFLVIFSLFFCRVGLFCFGSLGLFVWNHWDCSTGRNLFKTAFFIPLSLLLLWLLIVTLALAFISTWFVMDWISYILIVSYDFWRTWNILVLTM